MITNKENVRTWLEKMKISNYTINEDLTVDVAGSVYLRNKNLFKIPVQFGVVDGDFDISKNYLKSLKGSPHTVRDFYCTDNELKTLEFGPDRVNRGYNCSHNQIETLEFLPSILKDSLSCDHNKLKSFKGLEKFNELYTLFASHNELGSLEYAPSNITYALHVNDNQLTDLNHLPEKLKVLLCSNNALTPKCLKAIPENLVAFECAGTQISADDLLEMKFDPSARISFSPSGFAKDFQLDETRYGTVVTVDTEVFEKARLKARIEKKISMINATENDTLSQASKNKL